MSKSQTKGGKPSSNKTAKIAARCTPVHKASTKALANANGMTESELVFKTTGLLIDGVARLTTPEIQLLTAQICEKSAIGKNLNQIAYQLNRDNTTVSDDLIVELRRCQQMNNRTFEQLCALKGASLNAAIEYRKNLRD